MVKKVSGVRATNQTLFQRGEHPDGLCPSCSKELETSDHVVWCLDRRVTRKGEELWIRFREDLERRGTESRVMEALIHGLLSWTIDGRQIPSEEWDNEVKLVYKAQTELGWDRFMDGWW